MQNLRAEAAGHSVHSVRSHVQLQRVLDARRILPSLPVWHFVATARVCIMTLYDMKDRMHICTEISAPLSGLHRFAPTTRQLAAV